MAEERSSNLQLLTAFLPQSTPAEDRVILDAILQSIDILSQGLGVAGFLEEDDAVNAVGNVDATAAFRKQWTVKMTTGAVIPSNSWVMINTSGLVVPAIFGNCIGFVAVGAGIGAVVDIVMQGVVDTGLTTLIAGRVYYTDNSAALLLMTDNNYNVYPVGAMSVGITLSNKLMFVNCVHWSYFTLIF